MEKIKCVLNSMSKTEDGFLSVMALENAKKAKKFHESFPQYEVTPLTALPSLASFLGIESIYVKDESYRFGLNAFKVLGGSFAIASYIAKKLNRDVSSLPYSVLTSDALKKEFGQATFFTATDGNHGRGVAWAANKLSQNCVVYMPKGSSLTRLANIKNEGATATIEEGNYDDCVRMAALSSSNCENGVVVQDTAWEGYEEIPSYIMQGYATMAMEADEQLNKKPTHIFVQAGVGSLAGAVVGYFANRYPDSPPKFIIVEADAADCLYRSAQNKNGTIEFVTGDMDTIMAGLACGEPNTISWDILRNHASAFVSCPDCVTELGMRILAAPKHGDNPITSGESGAVTTGLLATLMTDENYAELKESLGLNADSCVLLFSTEGDTDPERYRSIVWGLS